MTVQKRCPNVSAKTVVQKVLIELLAGKASAKTTTENYRAEMLPKLFPQKQLFKLSLAKC